MGNNTSTLHKDIFKVELANVNTIVTGLINEEGSFKDPKYNMVDKCKSFQMVLESQLKKHLKVELTSLNESIYLIPQIDNVNVKGNYLKKEALCSMISSHYSQILKILLTVKQVYDVEHNGDNSLAGITLRNIRLNGNIFELHFCPMRQQDYKNAPGHDKINFVGLSGFQYFCDNILTDVERTTLVKIMRNLLDRKSKESMAKHMYCGDKLLTAKQYRDILKLNITCNPKFEKAFDSFVNTNTENFLLDIAPENPVLHIDACPEKQQLLIDTSAKTKGHKMLLNMLKKMKNEYLANINNVLKIAMEVVSLEKGQYVLKDIDSKSLVKITKLLKENISQFYIQSIINFHNLLDFAKTLNPTIVNWKDHIKYGE
jgi:hypothetical protein